MDVKFVENNNLITQSIEKIDNKKIKEKNPIGLTI